MSVRRRERAWLHDARYGNVAVPATAHVQAPPSWETVAEDGSDAWHDHRIHCMSPALVVGLAGLLTLARDTLRATALEAPA